MVQAPTLMSQHEEWFRAGTKCLRAAQWLEAEAFYRRILEQNPAAPHAHHNLGLALKGQQKRTEAVAAFRAALTFQPVYPDAYSNLGDTLREMGQFEEALAAFHSALGLRPDFPTAWNNMGVLLRGMDRISNAIDAFRKAVALRPVFVEAYSNLGAALVDVNRPAEAIEIFRTAISLRADCVTAWPNLAVALKETGQFDESLACYEQIVRLRPDKVDPADGRLCTLYYHPAFDTAAIFREASQWNARFAQPLAGELRPCDNDPSPQRRLRIGYVSPDWRAHCQSLFTSPLLANHDHQRFEITCYANVSLPDAVTKRLRSHADRWRDISTLSDQEVAQQIRRDKIDILVDLALHTAGNRLCVFARKPAPIQVTWLGYPGTTGLDAIDYRLTDRWLDPLDSNAGWGCGDSDFAFQAPHYSERSVYLSCGYWCYDPRGMDQDQAASLPQPSALPAEANHYMTFGCLNNFCKATDVTLSLWKQVLAAVGGSRLIMVSPPGPHRQQVIEKLGVAPERVEFVVYQPRQRYLETYRRIDLCLDTLPFNGGTTSLDGLWMGVPLLTRLGRTVVGRAGSSHLQRLGLEELIAGTDEEFVDKAVNWSRDLNRQSQMRQRLRGRMESSSLMDGKGFAQGMEKAYRQMWLAWCGARGE